MANLYGKMWFLASLLIDILLLLDIGLCLQSSPVSRSTQSTSLTDVSYYYQNGKIPFKLKDRKNRNLQPGNVKNSHDQLFGFYPIFSIAQLKKASYIKVYRGNQYSHQIQESPEMIEEWYKLQQKSKVAGSKCKSIDVNQKLIKALKASQKLPRPTELVSGLGKALPLSKRSTMANKMLKWSRKGKLLVQRSQKRREINPFYISVGGGSPKKFQKRSANYMEMPGPVASPKANLQNQLSLRHFKSRRILKNIEANKTILFASNPQANECVLAPSNKSLGKFRHLVYYLNLNFVQLHLIPDTNVSFSARDKIVENLKWVWTYTGKEGAVEFLKWPVEFSIWSLGLLTVFTNQNMEIELTRVQGNCSNIKVGDKSSDLVISKALNKLSQSLANFSTEFESKYGPSFFCYKKRVFVNPHLLYVLCKNIMCPLDFLKYKCCANNFKQKTLKREIDCHRNIFKYDSLWWTIPSLVAILVFASCPLLILYICSKCSEKFVCKATQTRTSQIVNNGESEIIYFNEKCPYTLLGTLLSPLGALIKRIPQWTRFVRFFMPFFSLLIITLQILLDYLYLHDFVINSIDKGVLFGFRSVIAGFRKSSKNFMPLFGGPYISLSIYLGLTCLSVTVPKCLSTFLESGLQKYQFQDIWTPLVLDLQSIEHFGSVSISRTHGFQKIYTVYLGKFYMILNVKFWRFVVSIFVNRWQSFNVCQYCWLTFPVYGIICILEIVICIVLNLLPIVSFGFTIGRAYCSAVSNCLSGRPPRIIMHSVQQILNLVIIIFVLYFLFMFCSICFDASLFITRVCMFTYTGIIVYPKESYGYLIFVFTVVYYIMVCSQTFAMKYRKLLKTSISVCKNVQHSNDQPQLIVSNGGNDGIHKPLFEYIVELHCPKRKQAFIAFFKFLMIVAILGMSLNLLRKTDRFKQLDTLVHVGTALFTCALPTIFINVCRAPGEKYKERALKKEIMKTVKIYAGYAHAIRDETELLSD